jgi:hypothetical protein
VGIFALPATPSVRWPYSSKKNPAIQLDNRAHHPLSYQAVYVLGQVKTVRPLPHAEYFSARIIQYFKSKIFYKTSDS